jgi:hypothetical protein
LPAGDAAAYREQLRIRRINSAVPTIEIAIDPKHPSRFEKNTNIHSG